MKKSHLLLLSSALLSMTLPAAHASQNMPAGHPKIELPTQSSTHEKSGTLSGKVLQSLIGGGYSYIYLQKKDGGKIWIAVKETRVAIGNQMSFMEGLVMKNFESKALKRTFDSIIFSNGIIPQSRPETAKTAPKDLSFPTIPKSTNPGDNKNAVLGSKPAVPSKGRISVAKAKGPNAYTVEEAYKKSAKLNRKTVVVHGKVVKASTGIMKKTWIHIQDGTGSQAKGNHNLVCTTRGSANVGDVITISGVLAKNRDFGYGYRYNVIIEDAAISK